ncbi:1-acyl-sn-glycerol-3-phosphate acyltransferase [Halopseudomonas xinjiangensis]|uniref:1-acyl-sn-glycerol-3-phosphate acyltransferase n=1 Tax=Halopseudomonas xinjiangensis TaxID=487184 RepID=A0A1H1XW90_9GAMM|nr:lysophospholipid acyltransferase family protein [Halopseudomonas xinjiangensis]SDT13036.1 1-acyl-sn-glycerol-3-phosphate acyltransferase [Halopseudomonas xinjiangensis]
MMFARVVLFYLLLSASAGIWGLLMLVIAPFLPYPWRYYLIVNRWCRFAVWLTRHIVGIRYEVTGRENIPNQPGVVLANHQSTWETFFLQQVFSPQTTLIKKELLYVPFFGWAFALARPIAIDRSNARDSLKQLSKAGGERLAEGIWILVFPEGTRVLPGQPAKFSRGGAALACANMAPVVPVAHNAGEFWPKAGWGKRPGKVTVMIGPAIYPKGPDPRSIVEVNRQAENWVNQALESLGTPSTQP